MRDIMEHLNVNNSMGHGKIGNLVLKKCHCTLNKSSTLIFQTCLDKGSFLKRWKISQVTLIIKEGNKAGLSCYRPIGLLCCCSIPEKVMFDGIYKHTKDRLYESQFGFRKRRSAIVQILVFLDRLYERYEKVKTPASCFMSRFFQSLRYSPPRPPDAENRKLWNWWRAFFHSFFD